MKKLSLAALVILTAWAIKAEMRDVPRGDAQALATADYGGVSIATSAFSTNMTTVTLNNRGVFYGINFSSGGYDFVDVWDSSSSNQTNGISPFIRLYNVYPSTASGTVNSGFSGTPKPIRFRFGLLFKASNAGYNMINALYYEEAR